MNVENLRKFLHGFSPDDTLYIGHPLHIPTLGTYMSGGAGYTITRQSLSLLIQAFNRSGPNFLQDSIPEDAALGLLLASIGATFIATVDLQNRLMSLPVRMTHYNGSQVANWYTMANSALMSDGSLHERFQCCSDTMISRHYISPENMFQGTVWYFSCSKPKYNSRDAMHWLCSSFSLFLIASLLSRISLPNFDCI